MASTQCLALPEMLEEILKHVPAKDLLPLQGVSTLWRDTIVRSVHIKRNLYKLAAPQYEEFTSLVVLDAPTLVRAVRPEDLQEDTPELFTRLLVSANPLLGRAVQTYMAGPAHDDLASTLEVGGTECQFHLHRPVASHIEEETFLDMYLTQPPVREVSLTSFTQEHADGTIANVGVKVECEDGLVYDQVGLYNPEGLKVKDVFEVIREQPDSQAKVLGFHLELPQVLLMNDPHRRALLEKGIEAFAKREREE